MAAPTTFLRGELPHGVSLFIQFDPNTKLYTLVREINDPSDGIELTESLRLTFFDQIWVTSLVKSPVQGRDFIYRGQGTATFSQTISQIGSPWDAEESVFGSHDQWTKEGLFSVTVHIGSQSTLTKINLDTRIPFADPFRSR